MLKKEDFALLDYIQLQNGRVLFIGVKNTDHSITQTEAYAAYLRREVLTKTIEIDGENVFEPVHYEIGSNE